MGIWSKKNEEKKVPLSDVIELEFQTQLFKLASKIGKLEHQRNEARRKHGVLKRVFKSWRERFADATQAAELAIKRERILAREFERVKENAAGQNEALMQANRELRLKVQNLQTDLNAAQKLLIAGESARQAS